MILGIDNIKKLNLIYEPHKHSVLYKNELIQVAQIEKINVSCNTMSNKPNHWINDSVDKINKEFQSNIRINFAKKF